MSTSTHATSALTRGYIYALVSGAILSTTAIFIRHLTQTYHIPALVLAFWRDAFVVLTLLPVLGWLRPLLLRVKGQHLLYLVAYGLVLALFNSLWTLSVALNGAAIATVLVYSSAGFTALLGWWLLQERLDWAKLLAVALSLGGCTLVSGALNPAAWRANLVGVLTGLVSGLGYALYSLMGRSASQRGLNPWTTLLYTFGFAAAFLLVLNLLPGGIPSASLGAWLPGTAARPADLVLWGGGASRTVPSLSLRTGPSAALAGWSILFLLAAGPTVAGFGLYNVSLSYLPSSVANLILTLEPAYTAGIAYLLLGERLGATQIGGSLLILGGVVLLRVREGRLAGRGQPKTPAR